MNVFTKELLKLNAKNWKQNVSSKYLVFPKIFLNTKNANVNLKRCTLNMRQTLSLYEFCGLKTPGTNKQIKRQTHKQTLIQTQELYPYTIFRWENKCNDEE